MFSGVSEDTSNWIKFLDGIPPGETRPVEDGTSHRTCVADPISVADDKSDDESGVARVVGVAAPDRSVFPESSTVEEGEEGCSSSQETRCRVFSIVVGRYSRSCSSVPSKPSSVAMDGVTGDRGEKVEEEHWSGVRGTAALSDAHS